MDARSALSAEARNVLALARKDRKAATTALAQLSLEAQLAVVCEAPASARGLLLELTPQPEALIPRLPEAEVCFTLKAIGIADADWLIEYATPEQIVAAVDLDAWQGIDPDPAALEPWIAALSTASEAALLRGTRALDPELLVLYLRDRVDVYLDPRDEEWQAPPGFQTLEGQFYFGAKRENDDVDSLARLLRILFSSDYWLYYRLMQGAIWELDSDLEEWARRWRTGRLQDMGFPSWDEAMRIYGFLRPEQRAEIPTGSRPFDASSWSLPVWMPGLPAALDSTHLVFRALAELEPEERQAFFYAFVAIANAVAIADQLPLGEPETLPRALDEAALQTSRGLEYLARENGLSAVEVLRRVEVERLFRVGANLAPEPRALRE